MQDTVSLLSNDIDQLRVHLAELRIKYDKLERELEEAADKLSDVWIHLDSWARGEADLEFIKKAAASILIHQNCPGWKDKTDPFGISATELRCPKCGYTKEDAAIHGDHHLCDGRIPMSHTTTK